MKKYINLWRKYGSFPILITQILTEIFCSNIISGLVILLWITVPCGIMYVNKNWWLWYPRQILFIYLSIIMIYHGRW